MVYLILADGFEEIEAIEPLDILRRGGVTVKTVSIMNSINVKGAHGITLKADISVSDVDVNDMDNIYKFVCDFYENRFSVRKLKKYTDIEQVLAVAGQIVNRVLDMMKREGVSLPNAQTAEKKRKSRILCRLIGFLKSKE